MTHPATLQHGRVATYVEHDCRCRRCRTAEQNARYQAARRAAGPQPLPDTVTHGLRSTYVRGCRCRPCAEASNAYQRERYRRRKDAPPSPATEGVPGVLAGDG